jgi:ELWxxDGT repeat protein
MVVGVGDRPLVIGHRSTAILLLRPAVLPFLFLVALASVSHAVPPPPVALVADVNPGPADGIGTCFVSVGGKLIFGASDGVHGTELWTSDGTTVGTVLVKDINPGPAGSLVECLGIANGKLVFAADDGVHGPELWISDATAPGTTLVKDIMRRRCWRSHSRRPSSWPSCVGRSQRPVATARFGRRAAGGRAADRKNEEAL